MPPGDPAVPPLWDFAAALYGAPGVRGACLGLQERHGLDVNLALFACWAARRGVVLGGDRLAAARGAVALWHESVVRRLRAARVDLKTLIAGGEPVSAASPGPAADLRRRLAGLEVEAERLELLALAALAGGWEADAAPSPALAAANLDRLAPLVHPPDRAAVALLADAAFAPAA